MPSPLPTKKEQLARGCGLKWAERCLHSESLMRSVSGHSGDFVEEFYFIQFYLFDKKLCTARVQLQSVE